MYVCAVYVNTDVYKSEVIVVACSRQKEARQVGARCHLPNTQACDQTLRVLPPMTVSLKNANSKAWLKHKRSTEAMLGLTSSFMPHSAMHVRSQQSALHLEIS